MSSMITLYSYKGGVGRSMALANVALLLARRGLKVQNDAYSHNLEQFDWEDFFRGDGGTFVEQLRDRWRTEFDIVLIDSRTGFSDTGGIYTIQMPDIIVSMFTANYQSLFGVRDVMRLAQKARQQLAYDRMPLFVLPLPARWEPTSFRKPRCGWIASRRRFRSFTWTGFLPTSPPSGTDIAYRPTPSIRRCRPGSHWASDEFGRSEGRKQIQIPHWNDK
jgi:hypothetical protein